jgi:TonB-dependent starch-binding outer membrane protein SusC
MNITFTTVRIAMTNAVVRLNPMEVAMRCPQAGITARRRVVGMVSLFLVGCLAQTLAAQGVGEIRGHVTSADGRPLEHAQISVVGTNHSSRTDQQGDYRIVAVPDGAKQLRAQQIGFAVVVRPVVVVAGGSVTADFTLKDAPLALEAIVVTGTAAEARKKEVGNSFSMISSREIEVAPVRNTQDIISARAPGVTVMQNSGQAGAGGTIRLRGNNSITQGNNPIIYVDGVRIFSEAGPNIPSARQNTLALNDIKAEDIARLEIVKGAAATTLYGTEASGGVIQIFTKKGTSARQEWVAVVGQGFNHMGHMGPSEDPTGLFVNTCRGPLLRDSRDSMFVDATCPSNGSWLRNGGVEQYNLSTSGGVQQMTYFLSGNYNDERGVIQNNSAQTGGVRGNFSCAPARNVLFSFNTSYNRNAINFIPDGNLANGFLLNVGRGRSGNFKTGRNGECNRYAGTDTVCTANAYLFEQRPLNTADHFITGLTLNWSPLSQLSNRFAIGFDNVTNDNSTIIPFGFVNLATGSINKSDWNHKKISLDYAGSYQSPFKGFSTTSSWGGQLFDDRDYFTGITGTAFSGPGDPTLGSASTVGLPNVSRTRVVNAGFFGQEMLGWKDRLFLTAGLRVDGNSAFGQSFGLQPYPKVSLAYVISEENWWKPNIIPTLKLRAAMGESGKAPGAFDAVRTWDPVAADEGKPAFTPFALGNPKLGPERTREIEIGFDASALQDRLSLEATAYRAQTLDALIGVNYPPSLGFTRAQLENVGTLENKGLELQLSGTPVRLDKFEWFQRVSYTAMKSEAIDLGGRIIASGTPVYVREGYPVPSFFATKITNPDANANPITQADQFVGAVYPTHLIGISSTLTLRQNLSFDILGEYQGGGHNANWIGYQNAIRFMWYPCYAIQKQMAADAAAVPARPFGTSLSGFSAVDRGRCAYDATNRNSDFWIQSTNFFKIRSASLSYKLPAKYTYAAKSATLVVAGRNLYKSTKYNGLDPELRDASDAGGTLSRREYYVMPPAKQFLVSLRATF